MYSDTVRETVNDQAEVLAADIQENHAEYHEAVEKFNGTPQTMGDIPTRIIGSLKADYEDQVSKIDQELKDRRINNFPRYFFKFWKTAIREDENIGEALFDVLLFLIVGYAAGLMVMGLSSYNHSLLAAIPFTPSIVIAIPFISRARESRLLREKRSVIESTFKQKIEEVQTDSGKLMVEVRNHIEKVQSDYRQKLIEVKGKFEMTYRAPRLEISRELRKLRKDRNDLKVLTLGELPERDELLLIVNSEIDECNKQLREIYPKEKAVAAKLSVIDQKITGLESSLEVLDEMKENFEQREERLSKYSRYQKDGDRWSKLMESKRIRELQEIENTITALDEEVSGTQFALSEVVGQLPGGNQLKLQEIRTKLLD